MEVLLIKTSPAVALSKEPSICKSVVFPAPLAPRIETISPDSIRISIPFKTSKSPKDFLIPIPSTITLFYLKSKKDVNYIQRKKNCTFPSCNNPSSDGHYKKK